MSNNQVTSYKDATGVIQYNMTNDYMFRYILQENEKVLLGLISSLLHLKPDQIKKVKITNPINLNDDINGKEFILDINIMLNNNTQIILEMQVLNQHNWTDRSLSYLCRSFDKLYRGQKYEEALPVIHIGFLDYTLFEDAPEFFSTNLMMNVKNHRIYNDKFRLSVLDLTQIELATEEDIAYQIDYWARFFKAKTWEEIKMYAEKNEFLQEAAQSVYVANADEIVRQKCQAREEAIRHERTVKRNMRILKKENSQLKNDNAILQQNNQQLTASLAEKDAEIAEKDAEIAEMDKKHKAEIAQLMAKINKQE